MKNETDNNEKNVDTEQSVRNKLRKEIRMRRIRKTIIWIVVIAIIAAGVYLFSFYKSHSRFPWQDEKPKVAFTVQDTTTNVYRHRYTKTIDISSYLQPYQIQSVSVRSSGTIDRIFFSEGDKVKKGDLLLTIDDTEARNNVESRQQALDTARINGESEATIKNRERDLEKAQNDLEYTKVFANFDGVVSSVSAHEGDYIQAGGTSHPMEIIDVSSLKATVEFDEIDVAYIHEGLEFDVQFDSAPGKIVTARIESIPVAGRYTQQGIGVKDVVIVIDEPPVEVSPGFTFSGTITVEGDVELLLVPSTAVTKRNGKSYLMKKDANGTKHEVEIVAHYLGEGLTEIISGNIEEGDAVVISSSRGRGAGASFGGMSSAAGVL